MSLRVEEVEVVGVRAGGIQRHAEARRHRRVEDDETALRGKRAFLNCAGDRLTGACGGAIAPGPALPLSWQTLQSLTGIVLVELDQAS